MNDTKIKIAFFSDVLKENFDGVTYTLFNIIQRVPRDKFDFLFITPYPPSDSAAFPFPIHVCRFIHFPLYKEYPFAIPDFDKQLKEKLDAFKPDLVHYTTPALLGRYAVKYALSRNIPLTSTYHTHFKAYIDYYFRFIPGLSSVLQRLARRIMLWFYNNTQMIFVPTGPILEELEEIGIESRRLMIWGRGIDTEVFSPDKADSDYMDRLCGKNTKRILFVSRLVWEKEIKTLLALYALFAKNRPDVKMIITGEGPQKKVMEKKMPGAVFTGSLYNGALSRIYASADVFVFPSITETFGNVVLEALASGLPVVAANQGGPSGILIHGRTGYLAVPKNAVDFYEKIVSIIDHRSHAMMLSANAVEYAKTQTWDALCTLMFATYEKIAQTARSEQQAKTILAVQCV
jgi:glycosyltransferase involved in cell wall biosynthesis